MSQTIELDDTMPGSEPRPRPLIGACVCGCQIFVIAEAFGLGMKRCHDCGAMHRDLATFAYRIDAYYDRGYHRDLQRHEHVVPYLQRVEQDRAAAAHRLAEYRSKITMQAVDGEWLDVGCGNAAFVDHLRSEGIKAFGIDPDPQVTHAHDHVSRGRITTVLAKYDVITYHDVIEHLPDPIGEIRMAAASLKHDGYLIIEIPNVWAPHGAGLHHFKVEHLWYFTVAALSKMRDKYTPELSWEWYYEPIPGKQTLIVRQCGA